MKLNIQELKDIMTKISLAVEKTKINPKSGWIELETKNNNLNFKVGSYDYYLEVSIDTQKETNEEIHVTILAETFIPLIAKLDTEYAEFTVRENTLIVETEINTYTFPILKDGDECKCVDKIKFEQTRHEEIKINGEDLSTVASVNAKGLVDVVFKKDIQQFVYVDNQGALTFTENMYVNNFKNIVVGEFKFLLNITQAKLLEIFKNEKNVEIKIEQKPTFEDEPTNTNKIQLQTKGIILILITQNEDIVNKFPAIKLRALAENKEQTHIIIDKKKLDKALARLMVFDKKFDITVIDYSKLVFKENELELVSIKNKNNERIPYINSQNAIYHESIIRFADLVKQLKTITSNELDISYGSRPAIVLNGNAQQIIPEIIMRKE